MSFTIEYDFTTYTFEYENSGVRVDVILRTGQQDVEVHNVAPDAHQDIRQLISEMEQLPGFNEGHKIAAFFRVDDTWGDPETVPVTLKQGEAAYYFTGLGLDMGTPWEYCGLYEGNSPDGVAAVAPTRCEHQPLVNNFYVSQAMYDLTEAGDLVAPYETDVETLRIAFVGQQKGANDPDFVLIPEVGDVGGGGGYSPPIPQSDVTDLEADLAARLLKGEMQFAFAPVVMTEPGIIGSFGQSVTLPDASLWEGEEITILAVGFVEGGPHTTIIPHVGQTVNVTFSTFELEYKYGTYPNMLRLRAMQAPVLMGGGWTWAMVGTSGPQFIATELAQIPSLDSVSRSRLLSQSFHETWPIDARCFRFPGVIGGASTSYRCSAGWGNIPNGIDIRMDLIVRPPTPEQMTALGMKYMELVTIQDPAMTGGDRMELAALVVSNDNIGTLSAELDFPVAVGDVILFWEHVPVGLLGEVSFHGDPAIQYHHRVIIRMVLDTAAGEVRFYRGVTHDGDETTTQGQHRTWRLVGTVVKGTAAESIVDMSGWAVDLGLRLRGDIFWMEAYHGPDGTLIDDVRATDATPGDTTFTSTGGRAWGRWGLNAEIVDPPTPATLPVAQADVTDLVTDLAKLQHPVPAFLSPSGNKGMGIPGLILTSSATAGAVSTGRLQWEPFVVYRAITIDRIGVEVTAAGTAGSLCRVGVFSDAGNFALGTLLLDAGTLAMDPGAVPALQQHTVSLTLQPGRYIGVVVFGAGTASIRAYPGYTDGYPHMNGIATANTYVYSAYLSGQSALVAGGFGGIASGTNPDTISSLNSGFGATRYIRYRWSAA